MCEDQLKEMASQHRASLDAADGRRWNFLLKAEEMR